MTHRPFLPPLYCHEDDASWIHHIPPSRALNTKAASASLPAPSCHLPSPPAPREARHSRLSNAERGCPFGTSPFCYFYQHGDRIRLSMCFSECRQITLPNPALQKASFAFPEGNAPARYRYQRLATRIRAMALVSASSARWTSVSGLRSARRSSARALACSALSTSMSEASSAASARMVTLLSAI